MRLHLIRWLLGLLSVAILLAAAEAGVIKVGVSLSTLPVGASRSITGSGIKKGIQLFIDWANNDKGGLKIGAETYTFEAVILEDNGNLTKVTENYKTLLNDSTITCLIGGVATDFNVAAAKLTEPAGRLLISPNSATDEFFFNRTRAFSLSPTAAGFAQPALLEMRVAGAKTITLVSSSFAIHRDVCASVPKISAGYNVNVSSIHWIPESNTVLPETSKPNLTQTVDDLIAVGADAVLICSYPPQVKFIVDTMKQKNYFPKLVIVNNMISDNFNDYENREYLAGLTQWDVSAKFPPDSYFGSLSELASRWKQKFNETIGSPGAHGVYAGVVWYELLKRTQSFNQDDLLFQLQRLDIQTLKGRLAWTGDHAQLATSIFVQYHDGSLNTVGPVLAATERMIYPAPKWFERVPNTNVYASPVDYGMTALQIMGIVSNIVFFIILLKNWNDPVIRASSPVFLSIILLGATLLYAQPWTMIPDSISQAACHLRPWLLSMGFGMMFGALFAKSWRVWRLYSNSGVQIFKITDGQLAIFVGILVGVEVILCVLISSISQPVPVQMGTDPLRPYYNYMICSVSTSWHVLIALLGVYNLLIILAGIYLAIRIRVIPYSVYNESKIIGFAIYNVSFFSILISVIYASAIADRFTVYGICTAFQVIGTMLTTCLLFLSKIAMMRSEQKRSSSSGGSGRTVGTGNSPAVRQSSTSSTEYIQLKGKYRHAKAENRELRRRLGLDMKEPVITSVKKGSTQGGSERNSGVVPDTKGSKNSSPKTSSKAAVEAGSDKPRSVAAYRRSVGPNEPDSSISSSDGEAGAQESSTSSDS